MTRTPWTPEQLDTLRRLYAMTPTDEIARQIGRPVRATFEKAYALGLRKAPEYFAAHQAGRTDGERGRATRFAKGQTPWNKGTTYQPGGRCAETQFKRGTMNGKAAALYQPVGTYRVNGDGYLDMKVTDDALPHKRWVAVHRLVWIAANGPIPRGHVVVFRPGRRTTNIDDITLDAIECISRKTLIERNTVHRHGPEIARLVQLRGAVNRQIRKHERNEA